MLRRWCLALCFIVLFSCNEKLVYSGYQAIEGGSWNKDKVVEFNFSEPDTINSHNIFLQIRNDDRFPYSNLFLIAEFNFPDGKTIRDTLEYEMALPDGNWLGKGFGSIFENKLWYKENIVFPQRGVYTLKVRHAMRKNGKVEGIADLAGITDVGVDIEKSN